MLSVLDGLQPATSRAVILNFEDYGPFYSPIFISTRSKMKPKIFSIHRNASPVIHLLILLVLGSILFTASPAFAQDGVGAALDSVVKAVTDVIQSVAVGAGILGLSIWGISKVARPMFPQIAGIAQNYIPDLLIGLAVIFVATEVVESLASTLGGGG
jgi:hypothetical protein